MATNQRGWDQVISLHWAEWSPKIGEHRLNTATSDPILCDLGPEALSLDCDSQCRPCSAPPEEAGRQLAYSFGKYFQLQDRNPLDTSPENVANLMNRLGLGTL